LDRKEVIANIMTANNGILVASAVRTAGIDNKELQKLENEGFLERIARGLYISPADMADEYFLAQHKCGKGVFSHETALYFHNLCDRTPLQLMITIPSGYNTKLLKEKDAYRFFYCKPELHAIGITSMKSPFGNDVRVYDKERTLCDCIKKKNSLDFDLVVSAIKRYMEEKGADFAKLLSYAEMFKIRDIVRQYMEALC